MPYSIVASYPQSASHPVSHNSSVLISESVFSHRKRNLSNQDRAHRSTTQYTLIDCRVLVARSTRANLYACQTAAHQRTRASECTRESIEWRKIIDDENSRSLPRMAQRNYSHVHHCPSHRAEPSTQVCSVSARARERALRCGQLWLSCVAVCILAVKLVKNISIQYGMCCPMPDNDINFVCMSH